MILKFIFCLNSIHAAPISWSEDARRLTGASESIRTEAFERLKQIPDLDVQVRAALGGPNHALALDTIAALRLVKLTPDLVRFSAHDDTGFSYLALNALIGSDNLPFVGKLYQDRLPSAADPAKMILLDTLAQMDIRLDPAELKPYLGPEAAPEVRGSALSYLRHALVLRKRLAYLPLLKATLPTLDLPQGQIQALYLLDELPRRQLRGINKISCVISPPPRLRRWCR